MALIQGGGDIPVRNKPEYAGMDFSGIFRNIPEYPEYGGPLEKDFPKIENFWKFFLWIIGSENINAAYQNDPKHEMDSKKRQFYNALEKFCFF